MDRARIRELNAQRLATLEPVTRALAERHIALCAGEGIQLLVVQAMRSMEEQAAIFAKGRSVHGSVVTNAPPGRSWHNFGRAYDVTVVEDGRINWNVIAKYNRAGQLGEDIGLVWGGRFTRPGGDLGHFEYHPGMTLAEARKEFGIS